MLNNHLTDSKKNQKKKASQKSRFILGTWPKKSSRAASKKGEVLSMLSAPSKTVRRRERKRPQPDLGTPELRKKRTFFPSTHALDILQAHALIEPVHHQSGHLYGRVCRLAKHAMGAPDLARMNPEKISAGMVFFDSPPLSGGALMGEQEKQAWQRIQKWRGISAALTQNCSEVVRRLLDNVCVEGRLDPIVEEISLEGALVGVKYPILGNLRAGLDFLSTYSYRT